MCICICVAAPKRQPRRPKTPWESENEANMEPSWHEHPAQINTCADNLDTQKNNKKHMKNQRKGEYPTGESLVVQGGYSPPGALQKSFGILILGGYPRSWQYVICLGPEYPRQGLIFSPRQTLSLGSLNFEPRRA